MLSFGLLVGLFDRSFVYSLICTSSRPSVQMRMRRTTQSKISVVVSNKPAAIYRKFSVSDCTIDVSSSSTLCTNFLPHSDSLPSDHLTNLKVNVSLFLSFRRVLNVNYSFLGNSPASEFKFPTFRNSLSVPSS